MSHEIVCGDVMEWAANYSGPKFHALLCDPPYSLQFMGKEWDHDIAFHPETWIALAEHLLPGAFGMAFASSRGWHRLAVAIEDAGLRIHPSIFGWCYGSGFPKATRIDTQIDKRRPGAFQSIREAIRCAIEESDLSQIEIKRHLGYPEDSGVISHWVANSQPDIPTSKDWWKLREILHLPEKFDHLFVELERTEIGIGRSGIGTAFGDGEWARGESEEYAVSTANHNLARAWAGHRYGLQALKPALEPIIVFQKPYKGKPIESIVETGAGALNIDGARIEGEPTHGSGVSQSSNPSVDFGDMGTKRIGVPNVINPQGRWPANFYVDEEAARRLGEQSGERVSGGSGKMHSSNQSLFVGTGGHARDISDTGTAARFFLNVDWKLEQSDPVFYCAKVARKERDAGLERFEEKGSLTEYAQGRYTQSLFCPKCGRRKDYGCSCNVGWIKKSQPGLNVKLRNPHPTVKPLKLTQWLATLLLPPAEYAPRRILVPFAGSGSEMIGAALAGWEEIIGIEMEREYCEIAEARLGYWTTRPKQLTLMRKLDVPLTPS